MRVLPARFSLVHFVASLRRSCSAEYFLFCEMLLQRPINMRELGLANVLSREETAYMREMASQRFDSIMQVLKSMPRPMLLVFRNINTVRSINITLGAPVDRYFIMAKRSVQKRNMRDLFWFQGVIFYGWQHSLKSLLQLCKQDCRLELIGRPFNVQRKMNICSSWEAPVGDVNGL